MKAIRRTIIAMVSMFMMVAQLWFPQQTSVRAAAENLAYGKPVTVSGVEGGYVNETTLKYPQFNPIHATDGSLASHTSLNYGDPQWIEIDLQAEYTLDKVIVHFANEANDYSIEYRTTAEDEWVELQRVTSGGTTPLGKSDKEFYFPTDVKVRYIRVYQYFGFRINGHNWDYSMGIYEIEAFEKPDVNDLDVLMESIKNVPPMIDGAHVVLPTVANENVSVSLYGSSNKAVVAMDGSFTQPLEDMKLNIFYKLTNNETGETLEMDEPVVMNVEGQYDDGNVNRPSVLPSIREWKGNDGTLAFSGNIVVKDEAYLEAAQISAAYIKGMTGIEVNVTSNDASVGDIVFVKDETLSVGDEGYTMEIGDYAIVKADTHVGFVYAGATLTQMLMSGANTLPKGFMRDYPQYEVRSTMIDLGRFYIPLDYVEEIVMYAAFFKMNEFHAHINDDGGEQNNAFRVESKLHPEINAGVLPGELYSQEDYKAFQKRVSKYGMDIVTEIDSPAHSACFANVNGGAYMMDGSHINISNEEALQFIESLYDEFLDGDDPVFQSKKFDIGADEYRFEYAEEMRVYMDRMTKYIAEKGIEPRLWCNLNDTKPTGMYQGFGGDTPVSNLGVQRYYNDSTADLQTLLDGEYRIINNMYQNLYIVPVIVHGCNDYLDIEKLYDTWHAGIVSPTDKQLATGHPLLMGAETSIWNDAKVGCSEFDLFDRCDDQIMLISEKCWFGEPTEGQTAEDFMQRVEKYGKVTPLSNPARYVETKDDVIVSYNFNEVSDGIVKDQSANGYDAVVNGLSVDTRKQALKLNGTGSISLPFDSITFPYDLDFDLYIAANSGVNAKIFDSEDGTLYYNYDGTGKFGFERKGYKFVFDFVVPTDVMMHYTLKCDKNIIKLYVEGTFASDAELYNTWVYTEGSSTFVLPTASIGSGIKGYLKTLEISQPTNEEATLIENVALNKTVEVSGVEGGYKADGSLTYPKFAIQNATDGSGTTQTSLAYGSPQHLIVDLQDEYIINRMVMNFSNTPTEYKLYSSTDKETWIELAYDKTDKDTIGARVDTHEILKMAKARYLKFEQLRGFMGVNYMPDGTLGPFEYSAGIFEVEAYGFSYDEIGVIIEDVERILAETTKTAENEKMYDFVVQEHQILQDILSGKINSTVEELFNNANGLAEIAKQLESGDYEISAADKSKLQALLNEDIDTTGAKEEVIQEYEQALVIAHAIFNDLAAEQAKVDFAVDLIENAKAKLTHVNVALNKAVEVSGVEGGYLDNGSLRYPQFNPAHVTDGNASTHTSLDYGNPQYVLIDLGAMHKISEVVINFTHVPREYTLYASNDKEEWVKIGYSKFEQNAIGARVDSYEMSKLIYARYIKMVQTSGHIGSGNFEYSAGISEIEVYGSEIERINIALNKPASASAVEGGTRPDGSLVYPQFDPIKATDGSLDTGRVSLDYQDEVWVQVDLQDEYLVGEVYLVLNPLPNAYKVQTSLDGEHWDDMDIREGLQGGTNAHMTSTSEGVVARYVRYLQTQRWYQPAHDFYYSSGVTEIMVYEAQPSYYDELKAALAEANALNADEYTSESYERVQSVLEEIAAVTAISKPELIKESAESLADALSKLEKTIVKVENLVATASNYKTITLTWDAYEGATNYIVERLSGEEWIQIAETTEPTYVVNGVKTGKAYTYRVKADNADYSDEASATTTLTGEVELTITPNGTNKFDLTWSQVDGATRYIIYRKDGENAWKKVLTLGKDATSYTSKAMKANTYQYQVKAARYDSVDRVMTNGSNVVEGIVGLETMIPANVKAEANGTTVTLTWDKVVGMTNYDIYRSKDGGAYRQIKRTSATTITSTGLKAGSTYQFKIRAFRLVNDEKVYAPDVETTPVTIE